MTVETYRDKLTDLQLEVEELRAQRKEAQTGDLISRAAAIDAVEFGITYAKAINKDTGEAIELFKQANEELRKAVERINQLPPVQPKIIRCKDCTHRNGDYCHRFHDGYSAFIHRYDYCSYAERRQ